LIDEELKKINQHMSTYIADSELMLLNAASVGEWHNISQPLHDVLQLSQHISEQSGGAFDITVGPLINLWGFGPDKHEDQVPDAAALDAARKSMGYQKLELADNQARKSGDIKLDLSAIAKGYGVDWIAEVVAREGVNNYMVEIGGEIRVSGLNPKGKPWRIAIEQPSMMQQSVHKAISITDMGMATSGDYRNYFEKDGKRYSHTIDPATGYPIDHRLASVTVLARTSAEADGWATAINVLGPEKGLEVANREQLAVYMIVKEGEGFVDRYSTAFEAYR
jgi:thiamine biosynthesis lipoprotein